MSLFQTSVVKKYLSDLSPELIDKKYKDFQAYFGNAERQENIRNSKEEEYQSGFINALFVNILGYTLNPEPNFNIVLEKKNVDDSKKADGAILKENEVVAVIELKSTQTSDLDTVETQAFGYKNHNPKCQYIITANFEKIRLYIQNAIDHLEFDLFNLTKEDFGLLWLCLVKENILQDIPLKIKESSVLQEENVTKKLYNDYSKFRKEIFENIAKNNPTFDKLVLFKKTQKLLDRFLFIFFAEDRLLLPPNSISEIVKQWTTLKEDLDEYVPLYERFKKYFGYLNTGFKGKKYDIFAYNGGLFLPDEILDNIKIDDEVLHQNTVKLSTYDFETDVDVNILGHIFEHSLSEIENLQAEIAGKVIDKEKTKRKKDGIFYTPKYITKYIVENTVGKLCEEKRTEFGIIDVEYAKGRKNRKKDIVRALDDKLKAYRAWLLELTILDPACGSGAFLNQALEFLIQEHNKIDELKTQLLGGSIVFPDIEAKILENNIFGVDLNQESVEIAKLSLWLRTAQKGRKLTTLSNHIKCGNSLIDDPEVAGEKAFNWQNEFPEVFEKGGFDVVIGNPPYIRVQGLKEHYFNHTVYYENNYKAATGNYDIYALFMEKSHKLLNELGYVSFILPHKFLIADFGIGIREYFINNKAVEEIVHFGSEMVFNDASTYTCIINLSKRNRDILKFQQISPFDLFNNSLFNDLSYSQLTAEQWILADSRISKVLDKISTQPIHLKDVFKRFVQGIITGKDAVFCVSGKLENNYLHIQDEQGKEYLIEREILKPHLRGEDVNKYRSLENKEWLIFPYIFSNEKAELISEETFQKKYPNTLNYLRNYEHILRQRENGKFDNAFWFQYSRNQAISVLEQPKIITPEVCFGGSMTFDDNNFYHNSKCHTLLLDSKSTYTYKSILPILNSSLFWFYLSNSGNVLRGGYIGVKRKVLEPFSLPKSLNESTKEIFEDKSELMLSLQFKFNSIKNKFLSLLTHNLEVEKLTKKLESFYDYDFKVFLKELNKLKVKLTLSEQADWNDFFEQYKKEINLLQTNIFSANKEIDQIVYELYDLTEEEIKIVEENS